MNSEPKSEPDFWGLTGVTVPDLDGAYHLPGGQNGDSDRRVLLAEALSMVYAIVGSAQLTDLEKDKARHAVHQLTLASGAVAASEADAFLTLVSVGLEAPALIHLRSLAETARRIAVCRMHPKLALQLYESAPSSWNKLASAVGLGRPNGPRGPSMRDLERGKAFTEAMDEVDTQFHLLPPSDWSYWSKRTHGDVCALLFVADSLRARGPNIRAAINQERPPNVAANAYLMRAIGICLFIAAHLLAEIPLAKADAHAESLVKQYDAMQERDKREGRLTLPELTAKE